jgi:opacity protein-like surface antigen
MNKTHIMGASLLIACGMAAQANNGWYLSASGGPTFADDVNFTVQGRNVTAEFDTGFNINGALGYRFGRFRLEGELAYLKNNLGKFSFRGSDLDADGDLSILGGLASLYFDILTNSRWTPYLGGGIGIANVSANDVAAGPFSVRDKDDNAFAYQIKAGLSYSLSDSIQAILGYRLFGADDLDIEDIDGPETHNIEVGLRYLF